MAPTNKNINRAVFEDYPVPKAVLTLALPTILGQLTVLFYNIADTFFIGRTNNPCMVAGASLLLPIYNLCIAVSNLAGNGGGALVSRLLGKGDQETAGRVSSFSFWFGVLIAAVLRLLVFFLMSPLLQFLGASADVFPFAKQYALCVLVAGAVPTVLSMVTGALLRSIGCAKQAGFGVTLVDLSMWDSIRFSCL